MSQLQRILMDPKYHDLLAILKGARSGFVYGVKIRFPHALVMTFLFSNKPFRQKLSAILKATLTHAKNLAKFVTIYKTLLLVQRKLSRDGKERGLDTFVAGLVGGWWVFGERNAINEQIVLYVASRVIASFLPRLFPTPSPAATSHPSLPIPLQPRITLPPLNSREANPRQIPPADKAFTVYAAVMWGLVMYIYRHRGERLQPGMVNSMVYLYRESETWNSLKTLLWHSK